MPGLPPLGAGAAALGSPLPMGVGRGRFAAVGAVEIETTDQRSLGWTPLLGQFGGENL